MNRKKPKLLRVSTVPLTMKLFCMNLFEKISAEYEIVAVSSPGKELDQLQEAGLKVCPVNMNRKISPLSDLVSLIRLYRVFRQERPDIVHSITPKAGLLAMVAAMMARVPVRLHSFTGLVFPTSSGLRKLLLMSTDFITCSCATNIHSEGNGVRRDLLSSGVSHKPVEMLGYGNIRGVDLDYYHKSDTLVERGWDECHDLGIAKGTKIIVFVGRIVKDKGIIELVEAFKKFSKIFPDWVLLLVGEEEYNEDPLPLTLRCDIASCPKIFTTRAWVDDVRPFYAVAQFLVLPSYREGFPNAVIEAGAMSLPSVVTDINGCNEIIEDSHNGIVVPPHDAEELCAAMCRLASDDYMRKAMGDNALMSVTNRYECGYVSDCAVEYYHKILPQHT